MRWKKWQIWAASLTGVGAVGAAVFWPRSANAMAQPAQPRTTVTIGNARMEGGPSDVTASSAMVIGYTTGFENSHPPAGIAIFGWDDQGNPLDSDGSIIDASYGPTTTPGAVLSGDETRRTRQNVAQRRAAIVSTGNGNVSVVHPGNDLAPVSDITPGAGSPGDNSPDGIGTAYRT